MQLLYLLKKYPENIVKIITILILCLLLFFLLKYKNNNNNYKIINFTWNNCIIFSYFFFFFVIILYLRYKRWGLTLNLFDIYQKILVFIIKTNIFYNIIIVLICCILITAILQLKRILLKELLKKHLYFYFKTKYKDFFKHLENNKSLLLDVISHHPYIVFIDKISGYWSYISIIHRFILYNIILPYSILNETDIYPKWMNKPLNFLFTNSHKIVLFIIFTYECYFNNCTLHIIFYYLPFYFFIEIYKHTTDFLRRTNDGINRIIYERYYEENNVLYVNTTKEEEEFILNYMKNNFICLSHEVDEWDKKNLLLNHPTIFIKMRRFCNDKKHINIFQNYYTQEEFDIKDILIKDDKLRNAMGFRFIIVPYDDDDDMV